MGARTSSRSLKPLLPFSLRLRAITPDEGFTFCVCYWPIIGSNSAKLAVGGPGIEETIDIDAARDHPVGQSGNGGRAKC